MQIKTDYSKTYLLPPSIEDWVPLDHPVRFIKEFVDILDLSQYNLEENIQEVGRPSYSNNLLLKVWLYSYYEKIYSSRQIEKACKNQLPFIWLTTMHSPDHNTIWRFFRKNRKNIVKLFRQTVKLAIRNDMVGFVLQAVDGTKIKADVSKNKTIYQPDIEKLLKMVDSSISETTRNIEEQEKQEKETPGYSLPDYLKDKNQLQKLIKEGISEFEYEEKVKLKENLEAELKKLEKEKRTKLSTTDPDARLMQTGKEKSFYYNAQSIVDSKAQIITGIKLTNTETDNHLLTEMIAEGIKNCSRLTKTTLADAGYFSGKEILKAEKKGYNVLVHKRETMSLKQSGFRKEDFIYNMTKDCYLCPAQRELSLHHEYWNKRKQYSVRVYQCGNKECKFKSSCVKGNRDRRIERYEFDDALLRHSKKLGNEKNKKLLNNRGKIVEPVFAWIKHNNNFKRWLYRGLDSVEAQWALLCSSINLSKLYSLWRNKRLVMA